MGVTQAAVEAQDWTFSTILRIQGRLHGERGAHVEMKGEVTALKSEE